MSTKQMLNTKSSSTTRYPRTALQHQGRLKKSQPTQSTRSTNLHAYSVVHDVTTAAVPASTRYTQSIPVRSRTTKPLKISWAGAGIFFFWQLGALKFLQERYDLTKVAMAGASGGALAAILGGCGVDADRVLESAYQLSLEHNIWERPMGFLGVWGGIIETWLDDLLPVNAVELCEDRIEMVVTTLPLMEQVGIKHYRSRADLINVAMASAHVPVLLDWKVVRHCRDAQCLDGSFPDFFTGKNCDILECDGDAVVFDYFDDPNLTRRGRMDMLELKEYSEIKKMMEQGYRYAESLQELGVFDQYVAPCRELGVLGFEHGVQHDDLMRAALN